MLTEKTPYLIHCVKDKDFGACGESTYLTKEQYLKQMSNPNRGWQCPQCGCYPCNWDDENYDEAMEKLKLS